MAAPYEALQNFEALGANPYPGRGIVMGRMATGNMAQVYWVMGRSTGSRNRLLVEEDDVVKTVPFDESIVDPAQRDLIIYNAMISEGNDHVVSNGQQTDSIVEALRAGKSFKDGLEGWIYEPDAPNFTPRISGHIETIGYAPFTLSVISRNPETGVSDPRPYRATMRQTLLEGTGFGVHTYKGDGEPLPSFDSEPLLLPLGDNIHDTAEMYWENLDSENRVALAVKGIDNRSGEISYHIINQLGE